MVNRRTHYSRNPVDGLRVVEQPHKFCESEKPHGLWYSVNGEWEEWCASEMAEWCQGGLLYALHLNGENLLRITTIAELDRFREDYTAEVGLARRRGIDWGAVADEFDGIEIAPYQHERRFTQGFLWYYVWDCASGCIWRPRGARVELLRDDRTIETAVARTAGR